MSSFLNFLKIKVPNKFLGKIGVSEVISVVLVVLMGIALAGTAYMWGIPMITKRQDTTQVERVYTYFERSKSNSLVRKIEFIAKNGGEDTFTPDVQGLWTLYEREEIGSDLVGYWKFDGDGGDSSSYANDGTFNGETFNDGTIYEAQRVVGKFGTALDFDDTQDTQYIDLPYTVLNGLSDFTITFWAYGGGSGEYIISGSDGSNHNHMLMGGPTASGWHFYVWRRGGGYGTHIYQDLVQTDSLIGSNPGDPINIASGGLIIAQEQDSLGGGFDLNQAFSGMIDEVRIFNRALSPEEIQAEMESSRPVTRPIAAWSFEEGSGQSAYDTHIWVKGEFGSALSFDGTNDYVDCGLDASLNPTDAITVAAWIYPVVYTGHTSNQWYIVSKITYPTSGWWFHLKNGGFVSFVTLDGTGHAATTTITVPLNQWSHIVGWSDGTTNKVFINGVERASAASGTLTASADVLRISTSSPDYTFNGTIDQVRIFNRALDEDEIKQLYLEKNSNSIEFITFAKVSNIAISNPATGIGWVALTPGGSCPPESGLVGFDPPYVVCAKGERFSEGFNVIYRAWFRELYESTGTKGYKINLIKHPSGHLSSSTGHVRISRGDVSSVVQGGKTLIITEIKILLV